MRTLASHLSNEVFRNSLKINFYSLLPYFVGRRGKKRGIATPRKLFLTTYGGNENANLFWRHSFTTN